eukprot:20394-Rhodomonas_salina.3
MHLRVATNEIESVSVGWQRRVTQRREEDKCCAGLLQQGEVVSVDEAEGSISSDCDAHGRQRLWRRHRAGGGAGRCSARRRLRGFERRQRRVRLGCNCSQRSEAEQALLDLDTLVGRKAAEDNHGCRCLWRTCHAFAQPDAVRNASDSIEEHRCQLYIVVKGLVAVHHGGCRT